MIMDKIVIKLRIEKLSREVNKRRYEYHVLDKPDVTDEVYDSLTAELRELEHEYPELVAPDSPTQRIGGKPLSKFQKVRHRVRQWSFDDVFNREELEKWHEKVSRLWDKTVKNIKISQKSKVKISIQKLKVKKRTLIMFVR